LLQKYQSYNRQHNKYSENLDYIRHKTDKMWVSIRTVCDISLSKYNRDVILITTDVSKKLMLYLYIAVIY